MAFPNLCGVTTVDVHAYPACCSGISTRSPGNSTTFSCRNQSNLTDYFAGNYSGVDPKQIVRKTMMHFPGQANNKCVMCECVFLRDRPNYAPARNTLVRQQGTPFCANREHYYAPTVSLLMRQRGTLLCADGEHACIDNGHLYAPTLNTHPFAPTRNTLVR